MIILRLREILEVTRQALRRHMLASFEQLNRHRDGLSALADIEHLEPGPSLGVRLAGLQQHLVGELRWVRSVLGGIEAAPLSDVDGRQQFLARYAGAVTFLARALRDAVQAGPVTDDHPRAVHQAGWQRVATCLTRLMALEHEARQL